MVEEAYPLFQVDDAWLPLTVQDLGRPGFQHLGIPVSGAMDRYALTVGNQLLGNDEGAAGLEVTLGHTRLVSHCDAILCITGADLNAKLEGNYLPLWETFEIKKGQALTFERPIQGVRAYVCVAGGIDSPEWLGSQSVYEKGGFGLAFRVGDNVYASSETTQAPLGQRAALDLIPIYTSDVTLRIVMSPYAERLTKTAVNDFFDKPFTFKKGDRMGCMLHHESLLEHELAESMISDVVSFGTIQIPANGQPMILLADRQTTGGYTTVGTVISADHWKCAQLKPGDRVRFQALTIDEADQLLEPWRHV
ncbi:biotin-dependent carboxyltransferase family protein [Alkalibacillus flavidus]